MQEQRLIDGIEVKRLEKIKTKDLKGNENGWLVDVLRATDSIKKDGNNFSQIYITTAFPDMVKGFHWHKKKTDIFFVVSGTAKLVLIDGREDSPTKGMVNEFVMGEEGEMILVLVPPYVKHAFKNIGKDIVYMLNYMNPAFDLNDPDSYHWKGNYEW
ncbi:MAG: dTDP-4-dehydrorhamnose 3,5-epimerase family protein [Candidatus Aenigmarchaeota archaeon]|nr:dTDP-4-dehydrorhamnose 3,5-epimerase family protein [Candidatus Aenigmarchaeota archaeon]